MTVRSERIVSSNKFAVHFWRRGFWLRVFGVGPHVQLVRSDWTPLFSERYGYTKAWYLGRLRFEWLTKVD